jgi:hypothetical protein
MEGPVTLSEGTVREGMGEMKRHSMPQIESGQATARALPTKHVIFFSIASTRPDTP